MGGFGEEVVGEKSCGVYGREGFYGVEGWEEDF